MANTAENSVSVPSERILEMDAVLRTLGFIYYNNVNACWFSTSDKKQTMSEGHSLISAVLEKHEKLRFTVAEGNIKINGEQYESVSNHTKMLVSHLSEFGNCNFVISRGLEKGEFQAFMDLISKPADQMMQGEVGDFTDAVNKAGFAHIESRKVVLKEVTDEDVVVSRKQLDAFAGAEKQKLEAEVIAILKGNQTSGGSAGGETIGLKTAMQDPERLADLVIAAAKDKGPAGSSVDKKMVAETVVECLDRAFQSLVEDPFSRTQKGKKAIASALQKLEKELLSKMQAEIKEDDAHLVSSAVERMTERLKMDTIVQDYTRKLKSLEESEKQILRFMKLQGFERLRQTGLAERLKEEGLDVSEWHELLAKSSPVTDLDDETARAVAHLGELLAKIQDDAKRAASSAEPPVRQDFTNKLEQINASMDQLALRAEKKIQDLAKELSEDQDIVDAIERVAAAEGKAVKVPRRKLMAVVTEVIQEFYQPLSVINCSVQMLSDKALGELTITQQEVVNLILESAQRIGILLKNLEKVSGVPTSLSPNQEIVGMLNKPD